MKLTGRSAAGYFAKPDPDKAGILIYGADAMRVALKRKALLEALLGPGADEEMRLTRIPGAELRSDPARLVDAIKEQGFFPGPRAVFVEDAGEAALAACTAALEEWNPGDAQIVVTAGALKATSKLRKLFESNILVFSAGLYDDPPGPDEITATLAARGLRDVSRDAMSALIALSREVGPGDFAQTAEKLSLYKIGDDTPLNSTDVEACAPHSTEAALDDLLYAVAEARTQDIGPLLRRIQSQGTTPVSLCIGTARHFRQLYALASAKGGPAAAAGRMRPPIFGQRRDRLVRQAGQWGADRLQTALTVMTDTDLALRSAGQVAPGHALVERALIRIAMLGQDASARRGAG